MLNRVSTLAHQTRLFPKHQGADNYLVNGLAARCDWVVLSDDNTPHTALVKHTPEAPKTVFLSLRSPFDAIDYFYHTVLPQLTAPFVLISGSEDITLPNQTDKRWRGFTAQEADMLIAIRRHPNLIHWWAENLDDPNIEKMSPLPLGLVNQESDVPVITERYVVPLEERPNTLLCAHRARSGPQWEARKWVSHLAKTHWAEFSCVIEQEVSEDDYFTALNQHSFVVCVEGGGVDPSPKAWHAVLNGAIPIICSPSLKAAYQQLPVVFVDAWSVNSISAAKLALWKKTLQPWYDNSLLRAQVLHKLGLDYWWDKIMYHYLSHMVGAGELSTA